MGKLKPLATLENGVIIIDQKKLISVIKKYEESKPIQDWLNEQLSWTPKRCPQGDFLIFVRLNPLGAKVFLTTEIGPEKIEIIRITGWCGEFRGKKWRR